MFCFKFFPSTVIISDSNVMCRKSLHAFILCRVIFEDIFLVMIFMMHTSWIHWGIGMSLWFNLSWTLCFLEELNKVIKPYTVATIYNFRWVSNSGTDTPYIGWLQWNAVSISLNDSGYSIKDWRASILFISVSISSFLSLSPPNWLDP